MEKITVLLVEDEQTLAMIIKDTLEGQNFIIHTAADGEEGLRKFFDLRPDVLVADVMMPRMDGFEMVRRIRQTDKQTPVLFLTARSTINDVVEGFELGANDYLKKPFGMQELIIRIKLSPLQRKSPKKLPFLKSVTTVSIPSLNDLLLQAAPRLHLTRIRKWNSPTASPRY